MTKQVPSNPNHAVVLWCCVGGRTKATLTVKPVEMALTILAVLGGSYWIDTECKQHEQICLINPWRN